MAVDAPISLWATISLTGVAWLLTYGMHSTLLLGLAWLIAQHVRSYRLKDRLWKTAMVGGILTTTFQVLLGFRPLTGEFDILPSLVSIPQEQEATTTGTMPESYGLGDASVKRNWGPTAQPLSSEAMPSSTLSEQPSGHADLATTWPQDLLASALQNGTEWLFGLWLVGAAAACLRFSFARQRFRSTLGCRHDVSYENLVGILDRLCRAAGVRRPVRLTCSPSISSPMTLGAMEICLPQRVMTHLSPEQQKSLLAHELAHLIRQDPLWLLLSGTVGNLFFFQPLHRLARRRIQECAEYLCDDWAARHTGCGLALARCLVEITRWSPSPTQLVAAAGMAESTSNLEQRVRRLVDGSWPMQAEVPRWWWSGTLVGVIALVVSVGPGISARTDDAASCGIGGTEGAPVEKTECDSAWKLILKMELRNGRALVGFLNESFGVAVGSSGTVHYTTDGGRTWPAGQDTSLQRRGLDIVDEQVAWSCGPPGNIRLSTDGGRSWRAVTDFGGDRPEHCKLLSFLDAKTGWAATTHRLGATTDGGTTWRDVRLPEGIRNIAAISLQTQTDGYLLDTEGTLFVTRDRGETWVSRPLGLENGEKIVVQDAATAAMRFADYKRGMVVYRLGSGQVWSARTTDGGRTWKREPIAEAIGSVHLYLAHDGKTLTITPITMNDPIVVLRYQEPPTAEALSEPSVR